MMPYATGILCLFSLTLAGCATTERPPSRDLTYELAPFPNTYIVTDRRTTIYRVAHERSCDLRELIRLNHLQRPYHLQIGQRLRIPHKTTEWVDDDEDAPRLLHSEPSAPLPSPSSSSSPAPIPLAPSAPHAPSFQETSSAEEWVEETPSREAPPDKNPSPMAIEDLPEPQKQDDRTLSDSPPSSEQRFLRPVRGALVRRFQERLPDGSKSIGVRFEVKAGAEIKPVAPGKVVYVGEGFDGTSGILVIKHPENWMSVCGPIHMKQPHVSKNQTVTLDTLLGKAQGNMIYFELRHNHLPVNPERYCRLHP